MNIVYVMEWEESEAGWGTRPDGYSVHLTKPDYDAFLKKYWASMPNQVQHEYDRPVGELRTFECVDDALFSSLQTEKSRRFFRNTLKFRTMQNGARQVSLEPFPSEPTFIELCLAKKAKPQDIDDFVDAWHTGADSGIDLRDRIGMTKDEYAGFIKDPSVLYTVLFKRVEAKLPEPKIVLHKKSGGVYKHVCNGRLENNPEQIVAIYLGLDGQYWVRVSEEFEDGRFVPISEVNVTPA